MYTDGYSLEGGDCGAVDCDDTDSNISPDALEILDDQIDNNCDGLVDYSSNIININATSSSGISIILTAGMGDLTSSFTAGVVFTVFGEGGANDSIYSVVSSAWTTVTTITVTETPAVVEASNGGKVWLKA